MFHCRQDLQRIVLVALSFALTACAGDEESKTIEVEAGPFCPLGTLPFALSDTAWRDAQNELQSQSLPRTKHQPADILANDEGVQAYTDLPGSAPLAGGDLVLRGIMARTKASQGLTSSPIGSELVSAWQDGDAGWSEEGQGISQGLDAPPSGQYEIALSTALGAAEISHVYAVLNADRSCGLHTIARFPRGRQVVVTDVDETLTLLDEELFSQIEDESYDQVQKPFGLEMTQAWASKGYAIVYLTARPHLFRAETRAWLLEHGYPEGPMITAPELSLGEAARQYKAEWVVRMKDDLGWNVVAAYGNAESDIAAYADAGIDKSVTFIIGEIAGLDGTVAIDGDSYEAHIADYVLLQPDAN